ncbi:MAG: transporter substrate-binding domain-containing protein [Alphaproteobacteria bacterium]
MHWFLPCFVAVFCVFALGSAHTRAESAQYCYNDWPPYAFTDGSGNATGISIEILTQASRRAGYEPVFTELPWERCLRDVELGDQDAVIDAASRDNYLQGDVSFSVYTNTFWVRQGYDASQPLLSSFAGKRLGLVRGYVYGDVLDKEIEQSGAIIDYALNDAQNIRKLAFSRTDAIIGDFVSTRIFAKENAYDLKPVLPHHSFDRLYPSFNRSQAVMHERIDTALADMMKDGTIDRIYHDALGIHFSDIMPDMNPDHNPDPAAVPQPDNDLAIVGY